MMQNIAYRFSLEKIFENERDFETQDKEWVYTQYVARVFEMSAAIGLAAVPAYWIFAIVVLPIIDTSTAIFWAILMSAVVAYQFGIHRYSKRKVLSKRQAHFILSQFSFLTIIIGIGWCILAYAMVQSENIAYLILGLFFVGGTTLTTIIAQHMAISICVFTIFSSLVPMSIAFWKMDSDYSIAASFLVLIYALLLSRIAFQLRNVSFQSIIVQRKQEKLVAALGEQTKTLNEVRREAARNLEILNEALSAMSDGIVIYDENDRQVLYNSTYRKTYDYDDDFVSLGNTFQEMLDVDVAKGTITKEQNRAYVRQRHKQRETSTGEFETQLSNGRWYQIRDRATRTGGTVTIHSEITDRKFLEAEILKGKQEADAEVLRQRDAIAASEKRFRAIVEDQTEMISRLDVDLNLAFTNSAYIKTFFGHSDESKVIGKNILDVIADEEVRTKYEQGLKGLTPEQPIIKSVMLEHVTDGSLQWQSWIDRALFDEHGNKLGYQSVGRDITPQKIAEQALAANLKERQAIVSGALDAIITFDSRGKIREFNPAAEMIFGWAKDDIVGRKLGELIIPKMALSDGIEKNTDFITYIEQIEDEDFFGKRLELELVRMDGAVFPAELAIVRTHTTSESELAPQSSAVYVIYLRDLSESHAIEAEMEKQRQAVAQNEKLGAMGSLLANVAHELNNPLAVVIGQTEILDSLVTDDATKKRTKRIRAAANRCAGIVKNFLAAVRQKSPELVYFDPRQPLTQSIQLVDYGYKANGIALELDIEDDLPPLYGDANQFGQVITNLMVNAQQALAISVPPHRVRLSLRLSNDKTSIDLKLSDNGPGIPIEKQERIFEPFFTTKEEGDGTGIGLAIAKNIIESHGGTIMVVTSNDLGGACFHVNLPVQKQESVSAEHDGVNLPTHSPQKRGHILIVDDESDVAETAADHFILANFSCETAYDGAKALDLLSERDYDAIISDIRMPNMDGPTLYRQASEKWPGIESRFGFFTGDNLSTDVRQFLKQPNVVAIDKPFTSSDLVAFAERLMKRTNSR